MHDRAGQIGVDTVIRAVFWIAILLVAFIVIYAVSGGLSKLEIPWW